MGVSDYGTTALRRRTVRLAPHSDGRRRCRRFGLMSRWPGCRPKLREPGVATEVGGQAPGWLPATGQSPPGRSAGACRPSGTGSVAPRPGGECGARSGKAAERAPGDRAGMGALRQVRPGSAGAGGPVDRQLGPCPAGQPGMTWPQCAPLASTRTWTATWAPGPVKASSTPVRGCEGGRRRRVRDLRSRGVARPALAEAGHSHQGTSAPVKATSRFASRFASRPMTHPAGMTADGLERLADLLDDAATYAGFSARPAWARAFRRAGRRARRLAGEERPACLPTRMERRSVAGFENLGQYCESPSEPRSAWLGSPNSLKTGVDTDGQGS